MNPKTPMFFCAVFLISSGAFSCDEEAVEPGAQIPDSGNGDDSDGQDSDPPDVTEEQEAQMCDDLGGTTGDFGVAGAEIGQGCAISPNGGALIQLVDLDGSNGGFVEISCAEGTVLFLYVQENVPVSVFDGDGTAVEEVVSGAGSGICDKAAGAYLWVAENTPHHLKLGPTSLSEVHVSLGKVE